MQPGRNIRARLHRAGVEDRRRRGDVAVRSVTLQCRSALHGLESAAPGMMETSSAAIRARSSFARPPPNAAPIRARRCKNATAAEGLRRQGRGSRRPSS